MPLISIWWSLRWKITTEFRKEAYKIASEFGKLGKTDLSEYIMALLSGANVWVPQEIKEVKGEEGNGGCKTVGGLIINVGERVRSDLEELQKDAPLALQ